ncbi:MAG: YtxH domain-containing protein [Gemmatimonadota bacterium]
MSDERGYGGGGLFMAFLAGGIIGAGLALLFAPVPGTEARKRIADLAGDVKRTAEGMAGDVKGRVESFVDEEKSVIKAAYEAGREAMEKERARFTKTE